MDIWGMSYNINKNYGLEVGNNLLKKIASLLKETFKETLYWEELQGMNLEFLYTT